MKPQEKYAFEPDYAVPPGATLQEVMTSLGVTQKDLAQSIGLTEQMLIGIFSGEQPISNETANRLEFVTDVPASIWNKLEKQYRELLAKLEEQWRLAEDIPTKETYRKGPN